MNLFLISDLQFFQTDKSIYDSAQIDISNSDRAQTDISNCNKTQIYIYNYDRAQTDTSNYDSAQIDSTVKELKRGMLFFFLYSLHVYCSLTYLLPSHLQLSFFSRPPHSYPVSTLPSPETLSPRTSSLSALFLPSVSL